VETDYPTNLVQYMKVGELTGQGQARLGRGGGVEARYLAKVGL
jgi:hypothetical protein